MALGLAKQSTGRTTHTRCELKRPLVSCVNLNKTSGFLRLFFIDLAAGEDPGFNSTTICRYLLISAVVKLRIIQFSQPAFALPFTPTLSMMKLNPKLPACTFILFIPENQRECYGRKENLGIRCPCVCIFSFFFFLTTPHISLHYVVT